MVLAQKMRATDTMITLKDRQQLTLLEIKNKTGLSFKYFHHGGAFQLSADNIMINQFLGNPIDGNVNNLYLRIKDKEQCLYTPLLGPTVATELVVGEQQISWSGSFHGIVYQCQIVLASQENSWNWNIHLQNTSANSITTEIMYAQDIGIATEGFIRANEAYCSQYIDHHVFSDSSGYTIASRQNLATPHGHSWLVQGCLQKTVAYVTDGFDFYGLSYKKTAIPKALTQRKLISEKRQYEFALIALQTEETVLPPHKEVSFAFFSHLKLDHPKPTSAEDIELLAKIRSQAQDLVTPISGTFQASAKQSLFNKTVLVNGESFSQQDIQKYFPGEHRHVEANEKECLSFFYDQSRYVALASKELLCERPHGHIVRSGKTLAPENTNILSSTSYMYGLFHSHVTIGNTSFNKILSISRSPLNIFKSSGQRIFIKHKGVWKLLNIASAYEVGQDFSRWFYKLEEDLIVIKSWTSPSQPMAYLSLSANKNYHFIVSNHLIVGNNEGDNTSNLSIDQNTCSAKIMCSSNCLLKQTYPQAVFYIGSSTPEVIETVGNDSLIHENGESYGLPFVTLQTKQTNYFKLYITGDLLSPETAAQRNTACLSTPPSFAKDHLANKDFWTKQLGAHFSLTLKGNPNVSKINDIVSWYLHNGLIHYSAPHGLEQFSGAAWGVRDVCQGPLEMFLSMGHTEPAKQILTKVFQQQYFSSADWPQWFMFDSYVKIQNTESHGDIIIWPLKALATYIEASNDFDFLYQKVAFTDHKTFELTQEKFTILEHVTKAVDTIVSNFIPQTHLSSYGDGDWNDTLQPADETMLSRMVSSWSVALTYQTFCQLEQVLQKSGEHTLANRLQKLSSSIKKDFNRYLVKDNIVSGFIYFSKDNLIDYMLHPADSKLDINYRLLPMIRSTIAELFDVSQMEAHLKTIQLHLDFPDGAHLMDKPVAYKGGVRLRFRRAEEAANFGREIGIQYVHAHLRYIEALCKAGSAQKAYESILKVIPITIQKSVPNAVTRQSNTYFSSSDGDFKDRYTAQKHFQNLKSGQAKVKGGWRIYSSGPGIFNNQIISHFLGIRKSFGDLVLDPVMPQELNGTTLTYRFYQYNITFCFYIQSNESRIQRVLINGKEVATHRENNPYRLGGLCIHKNTLDSFLTNNQNSIDIYLEN